MIQAVPKSEAGATWFSDFGSQVLVFRARWRSFFCGDIEAYVRRVWWAYRVTKRSCCSATKSQETLKPRLNLNPKP